MAQNMFVWIFFRMVLRSHWSDVNHFLHKQLVTLGAWHQKKACFVLQCKGHTVLGACLHIDKGKMYASVVVSTDGTDSIQLKSVFKLLGFRPVCFPLLFFTSVMKSFWSVVVVSIVWLKSMALLCPCFIPTDLPPRVALKLQSVSSILHGTDFRMGRWAWLMIRLALRYQQYQ